MSKKFKLNLFQVSIAIVSAFTVLLWEAVVRDISAKDSIIERTCPSTEYSERTCPSTDNKLTPISQKLNAQIQKEKNKQSQQKHPEDTRRKILMGALMMDMIKKGELDEKKILKRLDSFLTRDTDRKLFDV